MKRVIMFSFSLFIILAFSFSSFAQNISVSPKKATETYGQIQYAPTDATTITHSVDPVTVTAGMSVACTNAGITSDNQYWRSFILADFGITDDFSVTMVEVGIENALAGSGGEQPMTVNLYTADTPWPTLTLTPIGTATVMVPDQALTLFQIPVTGTAPGGSELVVEISIPDATTGENHTFYLGANNVGQTADSWLSSDGCGLPGPPVGLPVTTQSIGFPDAQWVMSVTGDVGGGTSFFDDFEAYTAGVQLVAQNNVDWDTWSGGGGTGEDPFVSDNFAYSGSNSVVIAQNNDLIRYHGELTSGKWYISLLIYIPTGQAGYFNSMSGFTPNPFQWAMEVYFDAGGGGRLEGVPGAPIAFSWVENTWQQAVVVVDLDTDNAEFWFGDSDPLAMVSSWQWTQGGTVNLQLDANDFFGATADDEMYVDDYYFSEIPPVIIPVELTSFTASVSDGNVTLNWTTATELNNQGFDVERNSGNGFEKIGFVAGFGTSTEIHTYSYVDGSLQEGTYTYRLKQVDYDGTSEYSDIVEVEVIAPDVFALEQNYPNPFNPSTTINFSLAADSKVTLTVFDVLGQEVANLISGNLAAGSHEINFNASNVNSGVYLYRIEANGIDGTNFTNVKKMILLK